MADPTKSEFETVLDDYQERRRKAAESKKKEQDARTLFSDVFLKLRAEVIAPAINDVATKLRARGFKAELHTEPAHAPSFARFEFQDDERWITSERGSTGPAELIFSPDVGKRVVRVEGRSVQKGGLLGEYGAEKMTLPAVSKMIEEFVTDAVRAAGR